MNNRIPTIPKMKIEDLLTKFKEEFTIGYWDAKEEEVIPKDAPMMYAVYMTVPPRKFDSIKVGLNYDFTEYLAWYFTTYFGSTFYELYYIELSNGYNYTFMIYQDHHGYHLIIPYGYLPVDGIVDRGTEEECVQYIVNILTSNNPRLNWIIFKYLPTGIYGVPMKQFMDEKWIWRRYYKSSCAYEDIPNKFNRVKVVL